MTNSELIANYESIRANAAEAYTVLKGKVEALATKWLKETAAEGLDWVVRAVDSEYIRLWAKDGKNDHCEIEIHFRREWNCAPRKLEVNFHETNDVSADAVGKIAYYITVGNMVKNLAKMEKEIRAIDWKSYEDANDLYWEAQNAKNNQEAAEAKAKENAEKAAAEAKLVKGAKLRWTRTNREVVIDHATPKFVTIGWNKYRKTELVLDILAGRLVFAA